MGEAHAQSQRSNPDGRAETPMPARRRAAIRDVAAAAGVSVTTVSHALNGYADVAAETARRIRAAAAELAYAPRVHARGLRMRRTWLIGVVLPDVTSSYFHELVQGFEDQADAAGYAIVLATSRGDPEREQLALETLQRKEVEGIIFASLHLDHGRLCTALATVHCPLVLATPAPPACPVPVAIPDPYDGVLQALHHLWGLGHRRVLYLAGGHGDRSWYSRRRDDAVSAALAAYQRALSVETMSDCMSLEHGYEATARYVERSGAATAVLAFSDLVATGALQAIYEARLRVPDDLSVVGFDDVLARVSVPPLTTVVPPKEALGSAALELLLEQMEGKPRRSVVLPTTLAVRASTGPARGAHLDPALRKEVRSSPTA